MRIPSRGSVRSSRDCPRRSEGLACADGDAAGFPVWGFRMAGDRVSGLGLGILEDNIILGQWRIKWYVGILGFGVEGLGQTSKPLL